MTTSEKSPARNALLLASRFPLQLTPALKMPKNRERWLLARVESVTPITIGLMHIPNYTTPKLKYPFMNAVHKMIDGKGPDRILLMGDTNCGKRGVDEENPQPARFYRENDWIVGFEDRGWVDAFRHLHGDRREYSWYSHRNNGFRLDYAFCSPELGTSIKAAQYVWGSDPVGTSGREALSDHAALIVDFENRPSKSNKLLQGSIK
jgi:exodeoxyribonuclease-3